MLLLQPPRELKMSSLLSVLLLLLLLGNPTSAFCPDGCVCDNTHRSATCIRAGLSIMPISLSPRVETIVYKYNEFPTVDVSLK
jgi:hypothetical protein